MRFRKCMGSLGVIGAVYVRFGKCMGTLVAHRSRLYEIKQVYGYLYLGGHGGGSFLWGPKSPILKFPSTFFVTVLDILVI